MKGYREDSCRCEHKFSISKERKEEDKSTRWSHWVSASMDSMKPLALRRHVYKSKQRKQWKREENIKKNRERRETMERLKIDMVEISEGQDRLKEGQREIRQKFEEIESECSKLKEETMNIAKQSDCNQIRINLMFSILKARQDNNFSHAEHLTQLLREEMGKPGLVG